MIFGKLVDWTWHGDSSYGPGILSWFHFLWLAIGIAGAVGFVFLAKKKRTPRQDDWVILAMDIVLILSEFPKHLLYDVEYYGYLRIDIMPFSFCSIPLFVALVGSLLKEGKAKDACYTFLAFFGIIGGIAVLCYPSTLETPFVYISLQSMVWHCCLLWMGVYLIAAKKYGQNYKKEILPSLVLFLLLSVCAVIGNEAVYYGYIEKAETPVLSIDRDPGAYSYYKYGAYDEKSGEYYLLAENDDKSLAITQDPKKAINFVITLPDGDNYDIFYLSYENSAGQTRYAELEKDEEGVRLSVVAEPSSTWAYAALGDHYVFASEVEGKKYALALSDSTLSSIAVREVDAFASNDLSFDFVLATCEREGDAANFFFISNHIETPIPVLNLIQPHVPYVVFILIYQVSFYAISSGIWGISHLIRKLDKKEEVTAE